MVAICHRSWGCLGIVRGELDGLGATWCCFNASGHSFGVFLCVDGGFGLTVVVVVGGGDMTVTLCGLLCLTSPLGVF